MKRQAMRQQPGKPILVRLFSSNINFKGVYLQQDIISRPSIVSTFSLLFSFHFTRSLIDMGRGIASSPELVNA